MDLRFMKVSPDDVLVRFKINDLAILFFNFELEVSSDSEQEIADALRSVLYQFDPDRFSYLAPK